MVVTDEMPVISKIPRIVEQALFRFDQGVNMVRVAGAAAIAILPNGPVGKPSVSLFHVVPPSVDL